MALPILSTPKYELTLPSTGKKYKYRPFLVKEEKILLMALEGQDPVEIMNAVKEIIKVCVTGLDVEAIAIFDLEYIFLRLREKSIGDEILLYVQHINEINSKGEECSQKQQIKIDLGDVNIKTDPEHNKKIELTDTIGVVMKYPTFSMISKMKEMSSDTAFEILEKCIDYIYDADKTYPSAECSPGELGFFLESLSHSQMEKIEKFFETQPKLYHEAKWVCKKCGVEETLVLQGLTDFFT